eukprot:scaffold413700_cov15-Prasinocladus_malaysianus.AAC.1
MSRLVEIHSPKLDLHLLFPGHPIHACEMSRLPSSPRQPCRVRVRTAPLASSCHVQPFYSCASCSIGCGQSFK